MPGCTPAETRRSARSHAQDLYLTAPPTTAATRLIGVPICPDLLDYAAIGEADRMRGRVVRAFFSLMRLWPA